MTMAYYQQLFKRVFGWPGHRFAKYNETVNLLFLWPEAPEFLLRVAKDRGSATSAFAKGKR